MFRFQQFTLATLLALVAQTANADLISCDFSSETDASILFTGAGDTIEFLNTSTYDFVIATTSPNLGGLQGNIGGTFLVGTITVDGGMETASVTTADGSFSVYDGANTLTADLDWIDIFVFNEFVGGLNVMGGTANLDNFSYSGSNSDLLSILNGSDQTVILTFQFSPLTSNSLTVLMADDQVNSTSYSGSLSSVPEPGMLVLLTLGGFVALFGYAIKRTGR